MEQLASGAQAPASHQEASTRELVERLSEQVSVLVRDEIKLARLEMTRKGKQAGVGAGMLGGAGLFALYAVACLLACAILGLSHLAQPWLAALIVGAALLAVSAVAALLGKARLQNAVPPVPEKAAANVRADVNEIKDEFKKGRDDEH